MKKLEQRVSCFHSLLDRSSLSSLSADFSTQKSYDRTTSIFNRHRPPSTQLHPPKHLLLFSTLIRSPSTPATQHSRAWPFLSHPAILAKKSFPPLPILHFPSFSFCTAFSISILSPTMQAACSRPCRHSLAHYTHRGDQPALPLFLICEHLSLDFSPSIQN